MSDVKYCKNTGHFKCEMQVKTTLIFIKQAYYYVEDIAWIIHHLQPKNKPPQSHQRNTTLTLSRDSQENANCPTGGIVSFIPKANIGRGLFRPFANIALLGGD